MADYDALCQAHTRRFMELMPEMVARLTWPVEQLRERRRSLLRSLVAHAQARSPWHRSRLAGIDAATLREEDLRALPVMTKDDLMNHFEEVVTDPRLKRDVVEAHLAALVERDAYLSDQYHACASGGSSGAAACSSTTSTRGRLPSEATCASSYACMRCSGAATYCR